MQVPHPDPLLFPTRIEVHFSTSLGQRSYPLTMTLSPKLRAPDGHSLAHFLHLEQKSCKPKSMGLSTPRGKSVVTTAALNRGPRKGCRTQSPIRHISPRPA